MAVVERRRSVRGVGGYLNAKVASVLQALTAPSGADWQVSLLMRNGTVSKFRVTPGDRMDRDEALRTVLHQNRISPFDVADATIVRVGEISVYSTDAEDEFNRLLGRIRTRERDHLGRSR